MRPLSRHSAGPGRGFEIARRAGRPGATLALALALAATSADAAETPIPLPPPEGRAALLTDLPPTEPARETPADARAPAAFEPPPLARADVLEGERARAKFPKPGVGGRVVSVLTLGLAGGEVRYQQAVEGLRDGRTGEAERAFLDLAEAERESPLRADALYWLGEIALGREDAREALGRFSESATASPPGALRDYADYNAGWTAFGLEKWEEARERFGALSERAPRTPLRAKAWFWRGAALARLGAWEDAAAALRAYLEAPDADYEPEARYLLATSLYHLGQYDASAASFDASARAAARPALAPKAMLGAALARIRGGVYNVALETTAAFAKRYPGDPNADLALAARTAAAAGLGRTKEMSRAFDALRSRHAASPWIDAATYEVAWSHFDKDDPARARALLLETARRSPTSPVLGAVYGLLGECWFREGAYAQAALAFGESAKRARGEKEKDERLSRAAAARFFAGETAEALSIWNELLPRAESEARKSALRLWIGEALIRQGKRRDALSALEAVPEADPGYPRALYQRAYAHFGMKDWAAAAPLFARFADAYGYRPEAGWASLGLGACYANAGRFLEAQDAFRRAETLLADPDGRKRALLYAGVAYYREGRYPDALRQFEAVEAAGPTGRFAQAAVEWWAAARAAQGDAEGAAAAYMSFLSRFPGHERSPYVLLALGDANFSLGRYDKAAEYYAWVREKYADSPAAAVARRGELVTTLQRGDRASFEAGAKALLEADPRGAVSAAVALPLADAYAEDGRRDEALALLRGVVGEAPRAEAAAGAWLRIARLELEAGRADAAREAADRLVSGFPTSPLLPRALILKAETLRRQSRYAEERAVLERVLADYGSAPEAREAALALGRSFADSSRTGEARARLAAAAERFPEVAAEAAYETGRAWQLDARYEEALRSYRDAVRAPGASPRIAGLARLGAADMLEALGRADEAEEEYRRISAVYEKETEVAVPALWREGVLLERRGLDKEAARVYEKMLARPDVGDYRSKAEARLRAIVR